MEYELFSRQQKRLRGEVFDVYQYETIPRALRVQIFFIWRKVWGEVYYNSFGQLDGSQLAMEAFGSIKNMLYEEYGVDEGDDSYSEVDDSYRVVRKFFLETEDTDTVIDVIEVSFRYIDQVFRDKFHEGKSDGFDEIFESRPHDISPNGISPDEAIDQLNQRFLQHNVGYQYESGQIIKVNSQFIHSEVVKPTLDFLSDPM